MSKEASDEVPPPVEAVERLEGVLMLLGRSCAASTDREFLQALPELICVLRALIQLGQQHPDELHALYLVDRRVPMPFGLTPPAVRQMKRETP